jgi:AP-3 complex subunit beta
VPVKSKTNQSSLPVRLQVIFNSYIYIYFHLVIFQKFNCSLAKYDQNYDIRDRTRFLRHLVFPSTEQALLAKYAKKIFLASKPAPVIESVFKGNLKILSKDRRVLKIFLV